MSGGLYLAGLAANAVNNATVITPTPAENALYPASLLQGGAYAYRQFRHGSNGTDPELLFDMNINSNPSFEDDADGEVATGWTVSSGSPVVSNAQANSGTVSYRFNADGQAAYRDFDLNPEVTYIFTVALYGDGTNTISFYVIDLDTGQYRTSSSWTTTKTAYYTRTPGSWASNTGSIPLQTRPWGSVGPSRVRLLIEKTGAGAAYVDDVALWPPLTCCALVDHNVPSAFNVEVHSSTDNFSASDDTESTMTVTRNRMFSTFTGPATPRRYWKVLAKGTSLEPVQYGQVVLGPHVAFPRSPAVRYPSTFDMPQVAGDRYRRPQNRSDFPSLDLSLRFTDLSANLQANLSNLWGSSRFGQEPVLIVPDDARNEFTYGRVSGAVAAQRKGVLSFEYPLQIVDEGLSVATK